MTSPTDTGTLLAGVDDLARALAGGRPPVLLDVRWQLGGPPGIGAYRSGHLPGAVFVDLDRDLSGPPGPAGRHPLPSAPSFQAAMRRAGVSGEGTVVVYDEADATVAARAWWLLRYFGHRHVRVLDGGYRGWAAAGHPVDTGEQAPPRPGDFTARPGCMPLVDADGAAVLARRGILLDARALARYTGEVEPVDPVAGHIPGAVSAPTGENVSDDGRFLPAAVLRPRFAALGVLPAAGSGGQSAGGEAASRGQSGGGGTAGPGGASPGGDSPENGSPNGGPASPDQPTQEAGGAAIRVGAYCGSGVTAAHEVLALALAGIPAALYPGSWSNWVADPARPVATGPGPG